MNKEYDIIIIGSGLNALSTLYGIQQVNKRYRVAIITGKPKFDLNQNHPKIFKDLLNFNKILSHKVNSNNLALPGNIGGLVFFWGEQCNINERNVIKKKDFFKSQRFFSKFLELKSGKRLFEKKIDNIDIIFDSPDKTIKHKKSIFKFKNYFNRKCEIYHNEAISISKNNIILDNKKKVYGKKIFLCAGLVGTINLLRSINSEIDFTFQDHSPSIDFVYSKSIERTNFSKSIYSMICKIYSKKKEINLYSKFYPLKSLDILFFLGKLKFYLPQFILKFKINLQNFYFVQKWHKNSISEYKLQGFSLKKDKIKVEDFEKLNKVYKTLNFMKIFTLKPNFLNYHFHNLKIIKNNKKYPVNIFLKKNNPNVYCPGLLSQEIINCLPPSFNSFIKTSVFIKNNLNNL